MATTRRDNRQEQELRAILDDIPGNDKCADCEQVNPRWASYSLGVFLCTRCAAIHRKNSDMSKVKSISLDSWTPEQIQKMREVGNTISNYKYNPLREWPMQDDDTTMERFIRDKYERHMFMSQRETSNFTPVKSAMKGSAKPIEPGKSSSAVIKYSKELDLLREMGFTDRAKNVDVLKEVDGDVTSATEKLIAQESAASPATPKKHEKPRVRFTADTIGGEEATPQFKAANPFDMWSQAGPASNQQNFQNPFSSIPPSMYSNQNFVQNVQAQGQQQNAPFMGQQATGQDSLQMQFIPPPAVPLRSQLTGGQPLRPQMTAPPASMEQQQQQPVIQPLRHQLTGRPAPPPPEPMYQSRPEQSQPEYQPQQPQNMFYQPLQPQRTAQGSSAQSFQASQQQPFQSAYPSQAFQQNEPKQQPQPLQNAFHVQDSYNPQGQLQPPSVPVSQSLTPQLTGMRPKFQPTVDLNAPFGQAFARTSSPQITGQPQQFQSQSPQRTGQSQRPQPFAPQSTGFQQTQDSNRYPALNPQQSQGPGASNIFNQGAFQSAPASSNAAPSANLNDPFGPSFTGSLRAQLTGIQNPSPSPVPGFSPQRSNQYNSNSSAGPRPYQAPQNQYSSMNNFTPLQAQNLSSSNNFQSTNQFMGQQAQPLFSQNTGAQQPPPRLYSQNTGGQGINPNIQYQQQPQNAFNQPQTTGQYGQQQQFQPQNTGYQQQPQQQQQASYGVNPAKPFDKAGIMSLYGIQQPQQYSNAQQQVPPQQQQQQQFYGNGYQQQQPQNNYQQQNYGGY